MRRLIALLASVVIAVVLLSFGSYLGPTDGMSRAQSQTASDKPNIVVVMTDDQDADSLQFMPAATSRLVSQGVRFTNFFSSQPLCCPNRATFLTGLYVHNHGITGNDGTQFWERGLDQSTVGTWLNNAGYETAYFGKYLNHYEGGHVPPGWDKWQAYVGGYGQYDPVRVRTNGGWTSFDRNQIHEADYLARESVGWLKGQAGDAAPKFMVVAPYTPHSPAYVAERHRGAYGGLSLPSPNFNERDVSDKPAVIRKMPRLTLDKVRAMGAEYRQRAAALLAVDDLIGSLLDELAAEGELDNTYFIYTSDNGWFWGEHRLTKKTFPYEEGAKQHLVVRGPSVQAGARLHHLVGMHDLAPTIASLAGMQPTRKVDGKSFKPLLFAGRPTAASWRKALLIQSWNVQAKYYAVRTQNRLYVEHYERESRELEHYYLPNDPYQLRSTHASLSGRQKQRFHDLLVRLARCSGSGCRVAEGS